MTFFTDACALAWQINKLRACFIDHSNGQWLSFTSSQQPNEVGSKITPILFLRKLRATEAKKLRQAKITLLVSGGAGL